MNYYKIKINDTSYRNILIVITVIIISIYIWLLYSLSIYYLLLFLLTQLLMFALHEVIHGLGFKFIGKVKAENIKYGISREKNAFYCACYETISKKAISHTLLLPVIVISFVTFSLGYTFDSFFWYALGILNLIGSTVDVLMYIMISKLPAAIRYAESEEISSFLILSNDKLTDIKLFIFELVETGKYDNKKVERQDKKILLVKEIKNLASYKKRIILFVVLFVLIALIDMIMSIGK